jgi:hypothetical protein
MRAVELSTGSTNVRPAFSTVSTDCRLVLDGVGRPRLSDREADAQLRALRWAGVDDASIDTREISRI